MKSHDEYIGMIQLSIDNELRGGKRRDLFAHLQTCSDCSQLLEEGRAFSARIRLARPRIEVTVALRERILTQAIKSARASQQTKFYSHWFRIPLAAAAMFCVVVGGLLFVLYLRTEFRAKKFVDSAVIAHRTFVDDDSLDVRSNSPDVVQSWFARRVSFPFRMPNAGIASDERAKYELAGCKLIDFGGERAALITFKLSNDLISLLVTSNEQAKVAGGEITNSDGLKFHARDLSGLHVVTWNNKGLTYALVSSMNMGGRSSCTGCHRDSPRELAKSTDLSHASAEKEHEIPLKWRVALMDSTNLPIPN